MNGNIPFSIIRIRLKLSLLDQSINHIRATIEKNGIQGSCGIYTPCGVPGFRNILLPNYAIEQLRYRD